MSIDQYSSATPSSVIALERAAFEIGFEMSCDTLVGRLLRTLVASKRSGQFLEIGTGVGVGCAWMLDGMDATSTLVSIEIDPTRHSVAQSHLGGDPRLSLVIGDALTLLTAAPSCHFDLIFADFRPGKFAARDDAIRALSSGGLYIADNLLPGPTWPPDHQDRVDVFLSDLHADDALLSTFIDVSSGVLIASKR